MNNIELAIVDEAGAETTEEQHTFELSLFELDMVGGGSSGMVIA